MNLRSIDLEPNNITNGIEVIRNMTSLHKINDMPPAEFWKRYDAGEFE